MIKLKERDIIRLRPTVIFGDDGKAGCLQAFKMALTCALDEVALGYANSVSVTLHGDNSITVEDNGRGIYVSNNDDSSWEKRFCKLDDSEELFMACSGVTGWLCGNELEQHSPFNTEGFFDLFGWELCAVQFASEFFDAEICRGGRKYYLHFEKGENVGGLFITEFASHSGTKLHFRLDNEVFKDINISADEIEKLLNEKAITYKTVRFTFKTENNGQSNKVFYYKEGIKDRALELVGNHQASSIICWEMDALGKDRFDLTEYNAMFKIALCFTKDIFCSECYHNNRLLEYDGYYLKKVLETIRDVLQFEYYSFPKLRLREIKNHLVIVAETLSEISCYENATKKCIKNSMISDMAQVAIEKNLKIYLDENKEFILEMIKSILEERSELQTSNDLEKRFECAKMDYFNGDCKGDLLTVINMLPTNDFNKEKIIGILRGNDMRDYDSEIYRVLFSKYKPFMNNDELKWCTKHCEEHLGFTVQDIRNLI